MDFTFLILFYGIPALICFVGLATDTKLKCPSIAYLTALVPLFNFILAIIYSFEYLYALLTKD